MATSDLPRLWALHVVDEQLHDIQVKAAAFLPGKEYAPIVQKLAKEDSEYGGKYRALTAEQTDLDLKVKSNQDKIAKIEEQLFGGKIVNPREVEHFQAEIKMLRLHNSEYEDRMLELIEDLPPVRAIAEETHAKLKVAQRKLLEAREAGKLARADMEADFKRLQTARGPLERLVPAVLLAKYNAIRKAKGTGMAGIKGKNCASCGMALPERTLQMLKEDKVVTCEGCRRILYMPVPEV